MEITSLVQSGTGAQVAVGTSTVASDNTEPSNSLTQPITDTGADTLSITSNKIIIAQQVVTQQINIALEIKSPVVEVSEEDNEDSVETLINKALQAVNSEKEASTEELSGEEKYSEAIRSVQIKIAQSFESATLELTSIGVMDDAVAESVDETRVRIDAAIDQVASQPVTEEVSETDIPVVETTTLNAVSGQRELTSALQITTKEGDVVTLNLSKSQAVTAGSAEGPEGSLAYAGSSSSSQIELSVQGDLSEKESKAIMKLVDRVNKIAEKLFDGNTGAAMGKLGALKIDTKQLADMTLSMSSSISFQAVSAYAEVSRLPDENTSVPASTDLASIPVQSETATPVVTSSPVPSTEAAGSSVAQVVNETASVVEEAVSSDIFENPFDDIRNLFAQIADMFSFGNSNVTAEHKDFIKDLFEEITDKLEADHDDDNEVSDDVEAIESMVA